MSMTRDCSEVSGELKDVKVFVVLKEKVFQNGTTITTVDKVFSREWQAQKRVDWIKAHENYSNPRVVERFVHGIS